MVNLVFKVLGEISSEAFKQAIQSLPSRIANKALRDFKKNRKL